MGRNYSSFRIVEWDEDYPSREYSKNIGIFSSRTNEWTGLDGWVHVRLRCEGGDSQKRAHGGMTTTARRRSWHPAWGRRWARRVRDSGWGEAGAPVSVDEGQCAAAGTAGTASAGNREKGTWDYLMNCLPDVSPSIVCSEIKHEIWMVLSFAIKHETRTVLS